MGGEAASKNRSRGTSGMIEEHLKGWLAEARKEEAAAETEAEGM